MRAVRILDYGGPDVARLIDMPDPVPGVGEVAVRTAFAGVNFMDIHTRQGKYRASRTYPVRAPVVLGMEGAGQVLAAGPGVTGLAPGDRVAWCLSWGSYAEISVVPADRLIPLPPSLSLELAAAATFHGLTAHYLLNDTAALLPGQTALVLAASGGIGQMLVQLGAAMGVRMLAVTSTPERAEQALQQGAAAAFTYGEGTFAEAARDATGGNGVDVVLDPIGAPTLRHSFLATKRRGLIVSFGSVGGNVRDLDPIELGEAGSLFLTRPRLADHISDGPTTRRRAGAVYQAILDETLSVQIDGIYPLEEFQIAHDRLEQRQTTGKPLVVTGNRRST
jgi:NADPH:quinone reductase